MTFDRGCQETEELLTVLMVELSAGAVRFHGKDSRLTCLPFSLNQLILRLQDIFQQRASYKSEFFQVCYTTNAEGITLIEATFFDKTLSRHTSEGADLKAEWNTKFAEYEKKCVEDAAELKYIADGVLRSRWKNALPQRKLLVMPQEIFYKRCLTHWHRFSVYSSRASSFFAD